MLGIAPATPLNLTRRNSAAEQKKTMTATDLIPAKYIKYTSVKSKHSRSGMEWKISNVSFEYYSLQNNTSSI